MITSYSARKVFSVGEMIAFHEAERIVSTFRLPPAGQEMRCHEIARAVCDCLNQLGNVVGGLQVVDGKYGGVEHSWIALPRPEHIIDTYAVGRLPMVQLVEIGHWALPEHKGYTAGPAREDIDQSVVDYLKSLVK